MKPNNVTRLLEQRKIPYTPFELPEEKLGAKDVAQYLGVSTNLVYKTIVVTRTGKGKPILAVTPGSREVNLKAVASIVGEKKVILPTERETEHLTGLKVGGISPLALLNRGFQVLIDDSAQSLDAFYISGGQRGLDILIAPQDLARLCNAVFAPISN